jgi:hypothetical protein
LNPPPGRLENGRSYFTARIGAIFTAPTAGGQTVWQDTTTAIPPIPATVEARKVIARFEKTLDIPSISIWKYTTPGNHDFEGLSQKP